MIICSLKTKIRRSIIYRLVNCYGLNGMGLQAVELFHQIPLEYIDEVTNICILNACSHSGLIDEARSIFNKIQIKTEKIYTTMVKNVFFQNLFINFFKLDRLS